MNSIKNNKKPFIVFFILLITVWVGERALWALGANNNAPAVPGPTAKPSVPAPVPMILPVGTLLKVQLNQSIRTSTHRAGQSLFVTLKEPVMVGNQILVQAGVPLIGLILQSKESGHFSGSALIELQLSRMIRPDGSTLPVDTESVKKWGQAHFLRNIGLIGVGVILGAGLGKMMGEIIGALIGVGLGGGTGAVVAYVTGKEDLFIKAGSELIFKLSRPLSLAIPAPIGPAK
jgi:hypothetical protein